MKYPYSLIFCFILLLFSCEKDKFNKEIAKEYLIKGDFQKAIIFANKVIKQNPNNIDGYILRSLAYEFTDEIDKEIKDYNKIINISSSEGKSSTKIYYKRYKAWMNLEQFENALTDIDYLLNHIEKNDSIFNWGEVYLDKGTILNMLDKQTEALHFYDLAEKVNTSGNTDFAINLLVGKANVEADKKNINNSIKLLNRAIEIDSKNSLPYSSRATLYMELNEIERAYQDFIEAKRLNPSDSRMLSNLALLQVNYTNEYEKAILNYSEALKLNPYAPSNGAIYMNMAIAKDNIGRHKEAIESIKKAITFSPEEGIIYYNYAVFLNNQNRNNEALKQINKAIEFNESDSDNYYFKGNILEILKKYKQAQIAYNKATTISSSKDSGLLCEYVTRDLIEVENLNHPSLSYDNQPTLYGLILDFKKDYSQITVYISSTNDLFKNDFRSLDGEKWKIYIDNSQTTIDNNTKKLCATKLEDFIIQGRRIQFSMAEAIHGPGTAYNGVWHLTYAKSF
tara:strand:+ start:179 stop:1705 length:1527 start_codon:yes stop_codon:yes gene_type:complete